MSLTSVIPWPYRVLAAALLALALIGFGWVKGAVHVQDEWDKAIAKQVVQVITVKQRQAEATVQVITKYVDRIKIVRETGATTAKEVTNHVTPTADAACVVPVGFVRVHNAAAANRVPEPAGAVDAAPAGIALSAVAGTVADNYERCHENAEQLIGLQEWILEMKKAAESSGLQN